MAISRRALVALTFLLLSPLQLIAGKDGGTAQAVPTPVLASPNVELIDSDPGTAAISGEFSPSAPFFYVSGLDSISVFDVSNPRNPVLKGKLGNLVFENEAMSYGERRDASGKVVKRFVLVGIDLLQVNPALDRTNPDDSTNVGGQQVQVVDVTDPANPKTLSKTPATEAQGGVTRGTHTVQCVDLTCDYAYTSGDGENAQGANGGFSIVDLRDLTKPRQLKTVKSPVDNRNADGIGGGHYWDIDDAGIAWHTGGGGKAAFDISDPTNPKVIAATNADGAKTPLNDFILHNSMRPNGRSFKAGAAPSLASGNVGLVTEEDYANDGDEVICDRSGTFQTWEIPDLDGAAYRAGNPDLATGKGTIRPLDSFQAPAETGGGASTPVGGFCSAHWFDYHQSGIVAQGWYQQGMRLIDVRDPKDIKQFGFFTGGASQVWDAYFVPARNADGSVKADRAKTNIVYIADAARGIDTFEIKDLPKDIETGPRTTTAADPFQSPPNPGVTGLGTDGRTSAGGGSAPGAGGRARCGAPTSRFLKGSTLRTTSARLRGTASPGKGCTLRSVFVSIGRITGQQCRFLQANGKFGAKRNCLRTQYVKAKGTKSWSFSRKVHLPRSSYVVWSRAINSAGAVERKARPRNLRQLRVRR